MGARGRPAPGTALGLRANGRQDRSDVRLLRRFGGTKEVREPVPRADQVPRQCQGPGCPHRREIGIDGNILPRLDVVDF